MGQAQSNENSTSSEIPTTTNTSPPTNSPRGSDSDRSSASSMDSLLEVWAMESMVSHRIRNVISGVEALEPQAWPSFLAQGMEILRLGRHFLGWKLLPETFASNKSTSKLAKSVTRYGLLQYYVAVDHPDRLSALIQADASEAAAFGEDGNENESLEAKAQKALDCPCIADLRKGSCGSQFSDAFLCFFKSTAEEKGSDCVHPFIALQSCIKANPNAFSKDLVENEEETEKKEEEPPVQDHRIIPPLWAKDPPRSGKSKL